MEPEVVLKQWFCRGSEHGWYRKKAERISVFDVAARCQMIIGGIIKSNKLKKKKKD